MANLKRPLLQHQKHLPSAYYMPIRFANTSGESLNTGSSNIDIGDLAARRRSKERRSQSPSAATTSSMSPVRRNGYSDVTHRRSNKTFGSGTSAGLDLLEDIKGSEGWSKKMETAGSRLLQVFDLTMSLLINK